MAELLRIISNGRQTYAELDGVVIGKHLQSIEFRCDATTSEKVTRVIIRGDIEKDLEENRRDFDRITDLMREATVNDGAPLEVELIRPINQLSFG